MFTYRRILFPVDYSAANIAIAPFVNDMAKRFQAHLQLVHACTPEIFYAVELGGPMAAGAEVPHDDVGADKIRLAAFAAKHFPDLRPELSVESGHPVAVVEEIIHRTGVDLIMLPTHGHGRFRRLLLGSVTARLIHDLSCSVWTASHADPAEAPAHIPYRHILCAVEPGTESAHVVKAAEKMAEVYGASLALISAIEWPSDNPAVSPGKYWERIRAATETELTKYRQALAVPASSHIVFGPIARVLHDAAAQQKADLIIVGRGDSQSPLSGVLSNLYPIVRDSPCPVLSI